MHALRQAEDRSAGAGLDFVPIEFAGQIAVAVWLGNISDAAACEALWCYALACDRGGAREEAAAVFASLMSEYRFRREWQDVCD